MQKLILLLIGAALLIAGGLVVPRLLSSDEPPVMRWSEDDEVAITGDASSLEQGDPALAEGSIDRSEVDLSPAASAVSDDRVDAVLRGRVVDKFQQPVASAKVWLDFGRSGQRGRGGQQNQRRVPDPVVTDGEGRFAFQGQAFRNLRVVLQVAHPQHAVGMFDKDLGAIGAEVDLGDLALTQGGSVVGRVTDLDGNGIGSANIVLQPENGNRLRFVRDREKLIAAVASDNNGFFRIDHAAAGEWTVQVTAKRHTEGRSPTFVVEEEQQVDLDDIRLGPGYEVTGYVRDTRGQPIAKAAVTLRSQNQGRGGRGGPGGGQGRGPGGGNPWSFGGGRDHSTTTDEQGRFFLEHLPGVPMALEVRADGYLDYDQQGIDATLGQTIQVAMQDGLRIAGQVRDDTDSSVVTMFTARAVRLRGLPVPGMENVDWAQMMAKMRDGSLSDAEQQQLRTQMAAMRDQFGGQGGRRGPQPPDAQQGNRGGRGGRNGDKPEKHAGGQFVLSGLQEGVYEVVVQSDEHTRYQSQEVELRYGSPPPTLAISLDRGVYVAGVVRDDRGAPIANARVTLRPSSPTDDNGNGNNNGGQRGGRGQRGQRGQGGQGNQPGAAPDFQGRAQQFTQQIRNFQQTLDERTNAEGEFIFKHATRGTYKVSASAQGYADVTSDLLTVDADRSGVALQLGMLGSIAGTVRGFREGEHAEVRVGAIIIGDGNGGNGGFGAMFGRGRGNGGPFRTADVNADGSYRIADLEPGNYLVRSWIGSPQELMRELGPQLFDGSLQADVQVRGGEQSKLDVTLVRPQLGVVSGTVMLNGEPGKGLQVELTQQNDNNGGASNQGGRGGRGMDAAGPRRRGEALPHRSRPAGAAGPRAADRGGRAARACRP
ncbi:MAG: carboxypeptidase regulatory-like domain-containing protein, partial [Planctomycetes bacterium]|nr:carboxypeptidase regulatory-like domain-containing protein [Planctomycetota bacterium]